jgi:hyperosmotically inducible periplasmic protein
MKKIAYLSALGALVLFFGCNKNSETSAGASVDTTTRSSDTSRSADAQAQNNSSAAEKSPDNTGKNVRDRANGTLTPGDQGENQQDLEITRRIRRAITSNDQLSQDAKNVKVITTNGKVTLRGPVASDQERKTIESIVQQVQGATVDDQLEVKAANQNN